MEAAATTSKREKPVVSKSPKQHKAPASKPASKGEAHMAAKSQGKNKLAAKSQGKDALPPSPPKPSAKGSKMCSDEAGAKKRKFAPELNSIAALAMQAGRSAAEASPKKSSQSPEDVPSTSAQVMLPSFRSLCFGFVNQTSHLQFCLCLQACQKEAGLTAMNGSKVEECGY